MNPRRNGASHFRVTLLARARESLTAIYRQAKAADRPLIAAAARRIHHRLETDPREFGEPSTEYEAARLDSRRGAVAPLVVYYGVHQTLPEVFVADFRHLPGSL